MVDVYPVYLLSTEQQNTKVLQSWQASHATVLLEADINCEPTNSQREARHLCLGRTQGLGYLSRGNDECQLRWMGNYGHWSPKPSKGYTTVCGTKPLGS